MRKSRRSGYTLIELMIAASIATAVGGSILVAANSLQLAFQTSTSVTTVEGQVRQAIQRSVDVLERAGAERLAPLALTPPFSSDTIDFQRAVGYDGANTVWGDLERIVREPAPGDPNDGQDNDGDGLVDEGRLVWIERPGAPDERRVVLVDGVAESLEREILGNGVDDNGNNLIDESGFCAVWENGRMVIRVSVARRVAGGEILTRTARRTIALKN